MNKGLSAPKGHGDSELPGKSGAGSVWSYRSRSINPTADFIYSNVCIPILSGDLIIFFYDTFSSQV